MPIDRTTPVSGVSFLVLSGVLWGTGGLLGRMLADAAGLSSFAVATYRLGVGGLLIVGYLRVTRRPLPRSRAAWRRIVVTGALAALFQAAYFTAVTLTSVSLATLVTIGSSPVLVLLARRRSAGRRQVAGVVSFVPGARSVGLLIALCLVPTAVAYTCYFRGLRTAPAALGALMALLEPLTAAVLAAVLLGDRLGDVGIAGALLLGAAVVLAGVGSRDRTELRPGGG